MLQSASDLNWFFSTTQAMEKGHEIWYLER
jgi:hypothetical protein